MPRKSLCCAATLVLGACGGKTPAAAPPPPAPDISVVCQPAAFSAGAGCATSACTVTSANGFTGTVTLNCAGLPAGVTCGFGPNPVTLAAGGSATTGFTVAADLTVPARVHTFEVAAISGSLRRNTTVRVETGSAPPPRPVSSRSMTVAGCAGYAALGSPPRRTFAPAIVGAWRDRFASFCTQTDTRADGRFDLEVPDRCYREGAPVYLTSGGMGACVTLFFAPGSTEHVVLIGSQACPGP
jgi:hypothetical protein